MDMNDYPRTEATIHKGDDTVVLAAGKHLKVESDAA